MQKTGFTDAFQLKLDLTEKEFLDKLCAIVDDGIEPSLSPVGFSPSENCRFIGKVYENGFKLTEPTRYSYDPENNAQIFPIANGTFQLQDNQLMIDVEINGLTIINIIILSLCGLIVGVMTFSSVISGNWTSSISSLGIFLFIGVFRYITLIKSVKKLKESLEKTFISFVRPTNR